jgi:hypothetical protein
VPTLHRVAERDAVQRAFDGVFAAHARFEKKSGSWYSRSGEVVSISNLQRSQYGPQYYVSQGFWLRSIDDERYPKSERAHIVSRLDSLLPDAEQRISELLDLENGLDETAATATPRWSAVREFAPNGSPLPATTPAFHTPRTAAALSAGATTRRPTRQ